MRSRREIDLVLAHLSTPDDLIVQLLYGYGYRNGLSSAKLLVTSLSSDATKGPAIRNEKAGESFKKR